jgi:hypothetical protein
MDNPVSKGLQTTFLAHAILSLVFGLALLLVPGRSLSLLGWVPQWVQLPDSDLSIPGGTFIDPLITRLLGAALLALAYLSLRCWMTAPQIHREALLVVEFEAVYCALSVLAILIALFTMQRSAGFAIWLILLVYAAFFAIWGVFWQVQRRRAG